MPPFPDGGRARVGWWVPQNPATESQEGWAGKAGTTPRFPAIEVARPWAPFGAVVGTVPWRSFPPHRRRWESRREIISVR